MLQVSYLRQHTQLAKDLLAIKHFSNLALVDQVIAMDDQRKRLQASFDDLQSKVNAASKEIGNHMAKGEKEQAEAIKQNVGAWKLALEPLKIEMAEVELALQNLVVQLPNLPHALVPKGKTPEENEVVKEAGSTPILPATAMAHWDLIKKYDIIDFELGNKITGAGFPVYKGKGARLQRALINFFLDEAIKVGYYEIQPPILINEDSGFGTGQLPDKEGQMYVTKEEGLFLIPTAEVPITNLYRDVIVNEKELPIKNVGHTPCFRREAGSWGAHVRGLNRLHQFDKIEIVQIHKPETSYQALEEMSLHVQGLLQKLNLHYRVLRLCGGDMGFASALTYDMEVWSGAQNRWLEVSSVSNFETFQANRLKLRTKVDGKSILCHTLNGSALALPRIVAALLENNQGLDGIKIPEILVPYTGFTHIN